MEFLITVIVILIFIILFLTFWVRNLILKLKKVAEKREQTVNILYGYMDVLDEISIHEMWSGEPMFREFKVHTEKLIRYLQTDQIHGEIKFLYEEEK